MVTKKKSTDTIITLLLITHIVSWILFMPVTQIQMIVFGRRIFSFIHYGVLELFLLMLLIIFMKGKIKLSKISKLSIICAILFLLSWFINVFKQGSNDSFVIMFYIMGWVFPFILITILYQFNYDTTKLFRFLLVIVVLHALIIFYQRFTNTVFWPFTTYENGDIIFGMDQSYTTGKYAMRCTGMATTALDAGILLIFGIVLTFNEKKLKKYKKILLITLFSIATLFTGTRNIYVMFIYMFLSVLLLRLRGSEIKKRRLLILFTIAFGVSYFYFIIGMDSFTTTGNLLTDTTSIGIRLSKWENTLTTFKNNSLIDLIFGFMKWQNAGNCEVIDNMYLEVTYCSGIICMFFYVKYVLDVSKVMSINKDNLSFVNSAFVLCYLIYGILNSSSNFYFTLILLLVLYERNKQKNTYHISVE